MSGLDRLPSQVDQLLAAATSPAWVDRAIEELPVLLLDHANCEKKAASTALSLMFRYPHMDTLTWRMSRLAREELRHYEQVQKILARRGIAFRQLTPARYAEGLRKHLRSRDPERLMDLLVVGAFIEARSCERFSLLAPRLDEELGSFYAGLLAAEARHFRQYLALAAELDEDPRAEMVLQRIAFFAPLEAALCTDPDPQFRFHSGTPA
jgi:tRNA-(ms[2]io[6]A)-hydroxylase